MDLSSVWRRARKVLGIVAVGVVVLVASIVGLAGRAWFWSVVKDSGGNAVERRPPVPDVVLPGDHRVYLALGDSYSSGEGVEPYIEGTQDVNKDGDRCHRSTDAYSQQIKFSSAVEVRFVACSGARVKDMYSVQATDGGGHSAVGAQLAAAAPGKDVGLVTLTIGGNDLGFSNVLRHCFTKRDCMDDVFDDAFDDGTASGLTLREWADVRLAEVGNEIRTLLADIKRDAPAARVIVLGYPNLLWSHWPDLQAKDCVLDVLLLDGSEANDILNVQFRFGEMIDAIAAETGTEFVSTSPVFVDHEPCGAITPRWLDFVVPGTGAETPLNPGTMHPNRNGHYILARVVACYLWANPEPVDEYDAALLTDCVKQGRPT